MGNNVVISHTRKKTNGEEVTYLYWGHSFYNKEKQRTDNKKICIGKYNERHEFVPNKTFLELPVEEQLETGLIKKPYLVSHEEGGAHSTISKKDSRTKYFGWVSLIEKVCEELQLSNTLKSIFPHSYTTLMNLIESSLTQSPNLYNNKRFHDMYWDFSRKIITKDEVSQVLKEVKTKKEQFFSAFEKTRENSKEYCVFVVDSTSFSTYSTLLQLAKYGFSKDGENLEQTNVLVVCEEETLIPLFYRTIKGNVFDKKVLRGAINEMTTFDSSKKLLLVLDKGFWDKESLEVLNKSLYDYIILVPENDSICYEAIEKNKAELKMPRSYIPQIERHCVVVDYEEVNTTKEMSLYIYFDPDNVSSLWKQESEKFIDTLRKLNEGEIKYNFNESSYTRKYFIPVYDKHGEVLSYKDNDETQRRCLENCGVYVCLAPKGMSKIKVHKNYIQRQKIEDGFSVLKKRDDNEANFQGEGVVNFLNLIVECGLRKKMKEYALDKQYTLDEIKEIVDSALYYISEDCGTNGEWIDLSEEQQILLYSMGIKEIENQYPNVKELAEKEKNKRLEI